MARLARHVATAFAFVSLGVAGAFGCDGCQKGDGSGVTTTSSSARAPSSAGALGSARVVAETLPRCRIDGARLALPGEDVVVGDAVASADALLVGVTRRDGTKRLASVVRASLDLKTMTLLEVGPAVGDDPPPSPHMRGAMPIVAAFVKPKAGAGADAGASADAGGDRPAVWLTRVLEISRIEASGLVSEARIVQQADESLAYDLAWPLEEKSDKPGIVAWDEDAPAAPGALLADRGVVKVQLLGPNARARVASPDATDAESPRLLARRGGYWLAWLARRSESSEDAGAASAVEGPGERRAHRWVEIVALDAKGEAASPIRRVSPEKGHVASFELATAEGGGSDAQLVVIVQDETAHAEGAGERIVRYAIEDKVDGAELLDGGVGHALAELLPPGADAAAPRWLAFTDTTEHAHLVPLGPALRLAGTPTTEPALDGSRVLASASGDSLYAVGPAGAADAPGGHIELRRLLCR